MGRALAGGVTVGFKLEDDWTGGESTFALAVK
jgi:hypothetical protein